MRVITDPNEPPALPMKLFAEENPVVVRLYVLRGKGLTPMDMDNGFGGTSRGKEGYSDPYLKIELGGEVWRSPTPNPRPFCSPYPGTDLYR